MKTNLLFSALLASCLCLPQGSVWAQPNHGNPRDEGRQCGAGDQGCERMRSRDNGRNNNQRDAQGPSHSEMGRGAGPGHSFYRGDRLPMDYRANRYVVDDWRGHGLRSPPRGYHWVQTGGDYVLVAIATGVILELLLNR